MNIAQRNGAPIRGQLQDLEVRMDASEGQAAMPANAARRRLRTEKQPRDREGRRELPDVSWPAEQQRVRQTSLLETSLNQVEDPAMPDDVWWAGD